MQPTLAAFGVEWLQTHVPTQPSSPFTEAQLALQSGGIPVPAHSHHRPI